MGCFRMSDVINKFSVGFNESKSSIPVIFESGGKNHGGGTGGDGNYEHLQQKPRINNVELIGNKTGVDLGLVDSTTTNAILSMIAGVEKSAIATKDYSAHDLVIVENKLYEITDDIVSGSPFIVGTNCKITTISGQLSRSSGGTAILG